MARKRVILVTGVAGYWGSRVAAHLVAEESYHVLGLDAKPPASKIGALDFVLADARNPLLVELLKAEGVDTVCHLAFRSSTRRSESAFDANVMGTTKLLGACADAGVRKVVLKSSTAVYGARPTNSAFLTTEHPLRASRRYGYLRDLVEIERFCHGFCRRTPGMALTTLRFSSIVGPTADTPMTRFLRLPWAPSLMGFDPMMQVIHEDDVVAALVHAVRNDVPGVFNVAAGDPMPLSMMRGLVGKRSLSVFHPFANWGVTVLGTARLDLDRYLPIEPSYLRYPWVADLAPMHQELGFVPRYTAAETLREFAAQLRLGRYRTAATGLAQDEEQMREIIARRRRAREPQAPPGGGTATGGGDDE
ncbi:MAG: NAD-dependent epimerase/dehydratase family protein [Anaerolineae bacterium]|jgi:UDP-glucose 4-epimerase